MILEIEKVLRTSYNNMTTESQYKKGFYYA